MEHNRGVDTSSSPGRNTARNQGHKSKNCCDTQESKRVARRNSKQKAGNDTGRRQDQEESGGKPEDYGAQTIEQDEPPNVVPAGPDRHAYADLVGALTRQVRNNSVKTDDCECGREQP